MNQTMKNRRKKYKELLQKENMKVFSTDREVGVVVKEGQPYFGEAGLSTRLWVLWPDGRKTLCAVKGMVLEADGYHIRS